MLGSKAQASNQLDISYYLLDESLSSTIPSATLVLRHKQRQELDRRRGSFPGVHAAQAGL